MKKIILTALTVLMIFGLVGCSGDLHDKGLLDGGWYVAGSICEWDPAKYPVVAVSSTEWYFDFTANDANGEFQICPGVWDGNYGGGVTVTAGGDPVAISVASVNAKIEGLTAGTKYRMTFVQSSEDFQLYVSIKAL